MLSLFTSKIAYKQCSTIGKSFRDPAFNKPIFITILKVIKNGFRCIKLRSSDNLKPFDTDYKRRIHESNSFFCGYALKRRWQSFYCL